MTIDNILGQLEGVKGRDGHWMARCPAHNDEHPSLSITETGGKVLLFCHAGCTYESIRDALGLTPEHNDTWAAIAATYDYLDEQGTLLYQVVRLKPKDFRVRVPGRMAGEWEWTLKNVKRRVLYRLLGLLSNPGATVWQVEGEKDADTLAACGLVATTNLGGAGKWSLEYTEALRGRDVVILPDNDEPGRAHAQKVAQAIHRSTKRVRLLNLPDLPDRGDVSDWLKSHTVKDLQALAVETPDWVPVSKPHEGPVIEGQLGSYRLRFAQHGVTVLARATRLHSDGRLTTNLRIDWDTIDATLPVSGATNLASQPTRSRLAKSLEEQAPLGSWERILHDAYTLINNAEVEGEPGFPLIPDAGAIQTTYLVHPLVSDGEISFVYGLGGVGKGWIALMVAQSVVDGEPRRGFPVSTSRRGPVLYLDWETNRHTFHRRWTRVAEGSSSLIHYRRCSSPLIAELAYVSQLVLEVNPALIIVDSAGLASGGDLNASQPALDLFRALRILGRTSLVLAHCPKHNTSTVYGNAYFTNEARSVWELRSHAEPGQNKLLLALIHRKANEDCLFRPIGLSLKFTDSGLNCAAADIATMPGISSAASIPARIRALLLAQGRLELEDVAEQLEESKGSVKTTLYRMQGDGQVKRFDDDTWGVLTDRVEEEIPF